MKRVFVLILSAVMLMCALACAEGSEPTNVTVQEWLDAKGEFESCRMEVTVLEIINPVLALVGDETGTVNLFGVTVDGEFMNFLDLELQVGETLVLQNPLYNEYEGSIEMADSVLLERTGSAETPE